MVASWPRVRVGRGRAWLIAAGFRYHMPRLGFAVWQAGKCHGSSAEHTNGFTMIEALKSLFEMPQQESETEREHRLHVAVAAMLVETSRADFTQDAEEEAAMAKLLRSSLGLSESEVQSLMSDASERVDVATSLYEFTRTINDYYSPEQKVQVISAMWNVAYADGDLDKYEEALIRKVAELTYVPHQDYIRCKAAAQGKPGFER